MVLKWFYPLIQKMWVFVTKISPLCFNLHISTVANVLHKPNCLFQEESSFHTAMLPEISEIWIFLLACKHQLKIYFSTTSFNNKGDHNIKMNMCNKQLKAKIENWCPEVELFSIIDQKYEYYVMIVISSYKNNIILS